MAGPCCIVRQDTVQTVCLCVSLLHATTYKISRFGRWGKASSGSDVSMLFPKFLLKRERLKIIWCFLPRLSLVRQFSSWGLYVPARGMLSSIRRRLKLVQSLIVEEQKTNLMSLAILFHFLCAQHVSDINLQTPNVN